MRHPAFTLIGLLVFAAGCASPANDRMTIGDSVRLEAFAPPAPVSTRPEQIAVPTLTQISRDNWQRTEFLVPADGTVHHPIYTRRTTWADKAARQRGEIPTAATALETYAGSETQQEYEALNNHYQVLEDLVFLVPRMIGWRPWQNRTSPDQAYQRYWHPERPEPSVVNGVQSVTP